MNGRQERGSDRLFKCGRRLNNTWWLFRCFLFLTFYSYHEMVCGGCARAEVLCQRLLTPPIVYRVTLRHYQYSYERMLLLLSPDSERRENLSFDLAYLEGEDFPGDMRNQPNASEHRMVHIQYYWKWNWNSDT